MKKKQQQRIQPTTKKTAKVAYYYDEEQARVLHKQQPPHRSSGGGCFSCCTRMICTGVTLLLLAAGILAALLVLYTGGSPVEFFATEDPPGFSEAVRWNTGGEYGLTLNLVNSLEDRYTPFFEEYVTAWDEEGTPDVLTLTTTRADYDPDCTPIVGEMNVCNGDYGDNGWRGINVIVLNGDYIETSVAKLNDFYLDTESDVQRQFTMCHELGHGFGLPHTDENQYNRDRGDCMDYTTRPQNNLRPGDYNFDVLNQLYGDAQNDTFESSLVSGDAPKSHPNYDPSQWINRNSRRSLREIPSDVMESYWDAMAELEGGHRNLAVGRSQIGRGKNHYNVDLGQGYRMLVSKLIAH